MPTANTQRHHNKKGLTIIELVVVATIIGLMASVAIPAFTQSRQSSIAATISNDLRHFAEQFNYYNMENSIWPNDGLPSTIPTGMEEYLTNSVWPSETPLGGHWDFDNNVFGFTAGISIDSTTMGDDALTAVDQLMDDGNLSTGAIIKTGADRLSYILEM